MDEFQLTRSLKKAEYIMKKFISSKKKMFQSTRSLKKAELKIGGKNGHKTTFQSTRSLKKAEFSTRWSFVKLLSVSVDAKSQKSRIFMFNLVLLH